MLTEFYFDKELFLDSSFETDLSNRSLSEAWMKFGCLVCSEDVTILELLENVRPEYRQLWLEYAQASKKKQVEIENPLLSSYMCFDDVATCLFQLGARTAFIANGLHGEVVANELEVAKGRGVELMVPDRFHDSVNFSNSIKYSNMDITDGENILGVWASRFESLAQHTSVITIFDRYCIKNLVEDIERNRKTSIEKFVELLFAVERDELSIEIYSADEALGSHVYVEVHKFLNQTLPGKPYFNSKKISIHINACKDVYFKTYCHERFLRFDGHVMDVGNGMQLFRDFPISNMSFNIKHYTFTNFNTTLAVLNANREWIV